MVFCTANGSTHGCSVNRNGNIFSSFLAHLFPFDWPFDEEMPKLSPVKEKNKFQKAVNCLMHIFPITEIYFCWRIVFLIKKNLRVENVIINKRYLLPYILVYCIYSKNMTYANLINKNKHIFFFTNGVNYYINNNNALNCFFHIVGTFVSFSDIVGFFFVAKVLL